MPVVVHSHLHTSLSAYSPSLNVGLKLASIPLIVKALCLHCKTASTPAECWTEACQHISHCQALCLHYTHKQLGVAAKPPTLSKMSLAASGRLYIDIRTD